MKNLMSDAARTSSSPFAPLEIVQNAMSTDGSTVAVELPLYRFNGVHITPGQTVEMTMLAKVTITRAGA